MINPDVKYAFNQFETSLVAFVGHIKLKLQHIVPNLPVYVQNTGDFSYYVDKKFVQTNNEEVLLKTPRLIIKIDDIQANQQEDTNQYNKIYYQFDDSLDPGNPNLRNYICKVRRKAYNVNITTSFVSSNFITMLNHIEVMATLSAKDNVFTYEFLGNSLQSAYTLQQAGNEIPSIDMGQGGTRNATTMNTIELQIHLLVPDISTIMLLDDTGYDEIDFGLVDKGAVDDSVDDGINYKFVDDNEPDSPHYKSNNGGLTGINFPK